MSYRIDILEARDVPSLRSGYAFSVWHDGDLVSDGHIKQKGGLRFAEGSPRPPASVLRELEGMADRYQKAGVSPEPVTFTVEEPSDDDGA